MYKMSKAAFIFIYNEGIDRKFIFDLDQECLCIIKDLNYKEHPILFSISLTQDDLKLLNLPLFYFLRLSS